MKPGSLSGHFLRPGNRQREAGRGERKKTGGGEGQDLKKGKQIKKQRIDQRSKSTRGKTSLERDGLHCVATDQVTVSRHRKCNLNHVEMSVTFVSGGR
ncbi:hypothetical protein EYF80_030658 [Liparis tanakae]|uniref:Uncharacterized protein n=1 Tax=Liparis tanakae TaxID=230148 RepID=A0A4Z2H2T4_9TELE|nr:hypothetical protein EYF80_030658 [Liparis tanakae]